MTVGALEFDSDSLANVTYSRSIGNCGMYGMTTSQLTADCYLDDLTSQMLAGMIQPNTPVVLSVGKVGFANKFPEFILGSADLSAKGVLKITAYDKCSNADVKFLPGTQFTEKDASGNKNMYSAIDVLNAAAGQIGFDKVTYSDTIVMPSLYYSEFVGKTCRQIFEEISKFGGAWYADGKNLNLLPYCYINNSFNADDDERTELITMGGKEITHAYITDGTYSKTYEYGSGEWWYKTQSVSGQYLIGKQSCDTAAANIVGKKYNAWKIDKIITDGMITPAMAYGGTYIPLDVSISFGLLDIVASVGAPAVSQSYTDYSDEKERALSDKVNKNTIYKNVFINENDGFTYTYYEEDDDT